MLCKFSLHAFPRALVGAFALMALSACGGGDEAGGVVHVPSSGVNMEDKTLAHHVHLSGYNGEASTRKILKGTQELCIKGKEAAGEDIEDPVFPAESTRVARVEEHVYYTRYATVTYTDAYIASMNKDTCEIVIPQQPTAERVRVSDGEGACSFLANGRGVEACALSRNGYRDSPKNSASGAENVTHLGYDDSRRCEIVTFDIFGFHPSRYCVRLRDDGWKSYSLFGTEWAGLFLEKTSALAGNFDDPDSVLWYFDAIQTEADIWVPNDVIYPHLSGKYNIDFIFLEDERHPLNMNDEDDTLFDDYIDRFGYVPEDND